MKLLAPFMLILAFFTLRSGFTETVRATSSQLEKKYEREDVGLIWAFGALLSANKDSKFIPVDQNTLLSEGDEIKIFLELQKKCFVYLIYLSAQGKIHLLCLLR